MCVGGGSNVSEAKQKGDEPRFEELCGGGVGRIRMRRRVRTNVNVNEVFCSSSGFFLTRPLDQTRSVLSTASADSPLPLLHHCVKVAVMKDTFGLQGSVMCCGEQSAVIGFVESLLMGQRLWF